MNALSAYEPFNVFIVIVLGIHPLHGETSDIDNVPLYVFETGKYTAILYGKGDGE